METYSMTISRTWATKTGPVRSASFLGVAALVCVHAAGVAAQSGAISGDLSRLRDEEIDRRYSFITERLDAGQRNSQIWQYGFTSGWGVGVAVGAVQASVTNNKVTRTSGIVTSVKAAGGVVRLLWSPNPGRHGSENIQGLPADSREDRLRRLAAAEQLFSDVEERAIDRLDWKRHALNVAINLAGAGVIVGVHGFNRAWDDGLISFGVGVTAGEVMSFTMPRRGVQDAEDYRKRFLGGPYEPEVSWRIAPTSNGLALRVEF